MTDQELASGIASGSTEALALLIERFHRPVLRYLWHAGGSKEDAEDLASQTLLRVRADVGAFRGEGSLRSWIFQVAYRELLRHRRRHALARLLTPKPAPEQTSDDAIVIAAALARVPISQRAAFLLTEVEGLSVDETAAALGIPAGTVKSRCHHARLALRKLLGATYGETHVEPALD